jgi:hypothetical protein
LQSLIKPLRLIIPASYPSSSLVILDELPLKVRLWFYSLSFILWSNYASNFEYYSSYVCILWDYFEYNGLKLQSVLFTSLDINKHDHKVSSIYYCIVLMIDDVLYLQYM